MNAERDAHARTGIEAQAEHFRECFTYLTGEIGKVFVGQPALIEDLLVCLFCQGHALIEGAPGLGKTLLVKTLSQAIGLTFSRVQCTPDLMPADVTGTNILVERAAGPREFVFQPGPLFANIVLADEINRATPRTQSAFLEAMQERRVTVFGTSHSLDEPFCVFATENPIEMEGTYPLPEAQLDRFFFKLKVRVPGVDDLMEIMSRTTGEYESRVTPRFGADVVRAMLGLVKQAKIADETTRLVLRLVRSTHPDVEGAPPLVKQYVRYGASPRAAQTMILAAKARGLLAGRFHASAADIRRVAAPALAHRLVLNFQAEMDRVTADAVVDEALASVGEV
jgi:MoxR-like ATPase